MRKTFYIFTWDDNMSSFEIGEEVAMLNYMFSILELPGKHKYSFTTLGE